MGWPVRSRDQRPCIHPAMSRRRHQQIRFRKRLPQRRVLECDRSATALFLRDHAVDVADTHPVGVDGKAPFGVVVGFRPGPRQTERTHVDVLDVEGLVNAVAVERGRDLASNPRLDIHVGAKRRPDQIVPEILAPFAVLGDHLERQTAARLACDHVTIGAGVWVDGLCEEVQRVALVQCRGEAREIDLRLLVIGHLRCDHARGRDVERNAQVGLAVDRSGHRHRLGIGELGPRVQQPERGFRGGIEGEHTLGVAEAADVAALRILRHLIVVKDPAGRRRRVVEHGIQRQIKRALAVGEEVWRFHDLADGGVVVHVFVSGRRGTARILRQFRNLVREPPVHRLATFIQCGNIHQPLLR